MSFLVPWRCLVPLDALGQVFGTDGSDGGFSVASGAQVKVSREDEAPATLSDKIVTVSGLVSQKEQACRLMLSKLWKAQGIGPDEEGIFVLIMPTCAVGAIIGTKGSKIKEIMDSSGADINVGREAVIGMPDNPMVLNGTQEQVLSATVQANAVLQELAERDRVKADDFVYIPGRQNSTPRPIPRGGLSGLSARFVVSKSAAGYLIGKGGQKVKEMKEESGANMQFRNAEEEPSLCISQEERVLEIRGGVQERDQGVRVMLAAMDQMPDPPRETRLLVPTTLDRSLVENAAAAANVELKLGIDTRLGSPEPGEVIAELDGPMFARSKALLGVLTLIDTQAGGSAPSRPPSRPEITSPQFGTVDSNSAATRPADSMSSRSHAETRPVNPMPSRSHAEEAPSVANIPASLGVADDEEERRTEPETGKAFTWSEFQIEFSKTYTADEVRDYWRDACKPVPKSEKKEKLQDRQVEKVETSEIMIGRETSTQQQQQQQQQQQSLDVRRSDAFEQSSDMPRRPEDSVHKPAQQQPHLDIRHSDTFERPSDVPGRPEDSVHKPAEQQHLDVRRSDAFERPSNMPGRPEDTAHKPVVHHPVVEQRVQETIKPSSAELGRLADTFSFTPMQDSASSYVQQNSFGSGVGSAMLGGSFESPFASCNFGGMPGYCQFGVPHTQLQLLLPKAVVQGKLVQNGQLAGIAEACKVQIDLDSTGAIPQEQLRVILSGSVVGNSLAALMLQGHMLLAEG